MTAILAFVLVMTIFFALCDESDRARHRQERRLQTAAAIRTLEQALDAEDRAAAVSVALAANTGRRFAIVRKDGHVFHQYEDGRMVLIKTNLKGNYT